MARNISIDVWLCAFIPAKPHAFLWCNTYTTAVLYQPSRIILYVTSLLFGLYVHTHVPVCMKTVGKNPKNLKSGM